MSFKFGFLLPLSYLAQWQEEINLVHQMEVRIIWFAIFWWPKYFLTNRFKKNWFVTILKSFLLYRNLWCSVLSVKIHLCCHFSPLYQKWIYILICKYESKFFLSENLTMEKINDPHLQGYQHMFKNSIIFFWKRGTSKIWCVYNFILHLYKSKISSLTCSNYIVWENNTHEEYTYFVVYWIYQEQKIVVQSIKILCEEGNI